MKNLIQEIRFFYAEDCDEPMSILTDGMEDEGIDDFMHINIIRIVLEDGAVINAEIESRYTCEQNFHMVISSENLRVLVEFNYTDDLKGIWRFF